MDPEKTGMIPPGEKANLGQLSMPAPAPPPYQDHQGLAQPGLASPQGYGYQSYPGGYGQQPYPGGHQYGAQPVAYTVQPTVYVTQTPLQNPVNDYLCYSVFTMLCCCLPLGIAALIYSISAREANYSGNLPVAERSSRMARILNHIALGIGIGFTILCTVYVVIMVSVASS